VAAESIGRRPGGGFPVEREFGGRGIDRPAVAMVGGRGGRGNIIFSVGIVLRTRGGGCGSARGVANLQRDGVVRQQPTMRQLLEHFFGLKCCI
jgi:hypothetical protein